MHLALTLIWANVLFMSALAVGSSVLAAVLALAIDKYREDRRLSNELAEYNDDRTPLPTRIPKQRNTKDNQ